MNILWLGLHFGETEYVARGGRHDIRTLAIDRPADYGFEVHETAANVIERINREWPVDLFVCWCPDLFPPPREIEHCPTKTLASVSDWSICFSQIEYNLARYDVVITDRLGSRKLRLVGAQPAYWQPIYTHVAGLHQKLDCKKDIDILFAGSPNYAVHAERGRLLEKIAAMDERYRIVIGSGYQGEDYTKVMNRARIVFNYGLRREMNMRTFEAIACGALLFVEETNLEVFDWLKDREEVVAYREDNLVDLLEYYLEHEDEREQIAEAGHGRAAALAAENRLDDLFEWAAAQPAGDRPFLRFAERERDFADVMQYASTLAPAQRALVSEPLTRLRERHADGPEFLVASGCMTLESLDGLTPQTRTDRIREAMRWFNQACTLAPATATLWLNAAQVFHWAAMPDAELQCLRNALASTSTEFGGLLLGYIQDFHYALWRRALATGDAHVEILWAAAAARMAEILFDQGRFEEASRIAADSVMWCPGASRPYRTAAAAQRALGNPEMAARLLEEGLEFTAFDEAYRIDLVNTLREFGETRKAKALVEQSRLIFSRCVGKDAVTARFAELPEAIQERPADPSDV